LLVAACGGQTTGATNVGQTTATLTASGWCDPNDAGRIYWEVRKVGSSSWQRQYHDFDGRVLPQGGSKVQTTQCGSRLPASGSASLSQVIDGLTPGASYQYRVGFRFTSNNGDAWTDSTGAVGPSDANAVYHSFTTQPCDDTQGASETLAAFIASNPAGTSGDPQLLCVRGGTQTIGLVAPKAYQTIKGVSDNTLRGNVNIANTGVTLEDLKLEGCFATAGCSPGSAQNKVVMVNGSGATLRYDDISQQGGKGAQDMQCIQVGEEPQGGPNIRPTGVVIENSRIHACGVENGQFGPDHDHAIYCQNAAAPKFVGNWLYDAEGWGFHFYFNCDDSVIDGNMNAENGNSCVLGVIDGVDTTSNAHFRYGFCGFSRQHVTSGNPGASNEDPIHCEAGSPPVNGDTLDMVLYDPEAPGVTDCGSQLAQTNTLTADPGFVDRDGSDGTYDLRPTTTAAKEHTGLRYAENIPGPSW
jgi:hypothetical protein